MGRRGHRRTLAPNIYEDGTGRAGIYRTPDGQAHEVRFPPGTGLALIRRELGKRKARASGSGRASTLRGSLAAAVDQWEPLEQHIASWKERRAELRAWVRELGTVPLGAITSQDIRRVIGTWTQTGVAPKTIRQRMWSLQHLYRVLYGPRVDTPLDEVPRPPKVRHIPTIIDPALILRVYANLLQMEADGLLRDGKTRARFMLRASTGKRPSEIMRAVPADVNLERREWRVRDGKGGWSEGLYLNDDMLAAWRVFIDADAWGPFNTGSFAEVLRHAGWPAGVRPYELRHNVGIALSDVGVDLADIAGVLGHKDLRTTRQTYVPIRNARMQRASQLLEGRLSGWHVAPHGTTE